MTQLSKREIEILQLISQEYTSKEIAAVLSLSNHTILSHSRKIREKLGVKNTAGVVRVGFEIGYLGIPKRSASQCVVPN